MRTAHLQSTEKILTGLSVSVSLGLCFSVLACDALSLDNPVELFGILGILLLSLASFSMVVCGLAFDLIPEVEGHRKVSVRTKQTTGFAFVFSITEQ